MAAIPNRAVFRSQEVCEIAEVQPYVLRTWEAEFPDLGMSKSAGAPRVYRRGDVERVLRLKHLLFVEGLTLAGARRQLSEEDPGLASIAPAEDADVADSEVAALLDRTVRNNLREVKSGLQWILGVLNGTGSGNGNGNGALRLVSADRSKRAVKKDGRAARPAKQVRSSRPSRTARSARPTRNAKKSAGKKRR
jgi:DNA-binding transcriptional MerR regulator